MTKSILIDPSKCMACRSCQVACKQWNQLPAEDTSFTGSYENPPGMSINTWMRITFNEVEDKNGKVKWFFGNQRCMHCTDAACEISCPSGAIYHTDMGTVAIDENKCIGCNYCVANCPFHAVSFNRASNLPFKCTFCFDRTSNGLQPACAKACPTGAITFGERNDLVSAASRRVDQLKKAGNQNATIYGLEEVNGTGMLYVLADDPELFGLPADPQVPFGARLWGAIFKPVRILVVLALGLGLWANKAKVKEVEEAKKTQKTSS